jgi:hypothetical protein
MIAYSEQVGVYLQLFGNMGDKTYWYIFTRAIRISDIALFSVVSNILKNRATGMVNFSKG